MTHLPHRTQAPAFLGVTEPMLDVVSPTSGPVGRVIPRLYIDEPLMRPATRPAHPTATRTRDSQRMRVYRWEDRHGALGDAFGRIDELEGIADWARHVWVAEAPRYHRNVEAAPQVATPRSRQRRAYANVRTSTISIPPTMRTRWVILHEVAHLLAGSDARHGGVFVGVLIGLLTRHLSLNRADLAFSAVAAGISVDLRSIGW